MKGQFQRANNRDILFLNLIPARIKHANSLFVGLLVAFEIACAPVAKGEVTGWGDNSFGEIRIPAGLTEVSAIACGLRHSLALRRDGTVAAWGGNWAGQTNVPAGLNNVVAIAGGSQHSLALRADGAVTAWGTYNLGSSSRPATPPAGLNDVVGIAAGDSHSLALRRDGSVMAWGNNNYGQTNVPGGLSNVVALAGGNTHSLALRADGTVSAWGSGAAAAVPPGLSNVVAVAAGGGQSLALRADGTVVAWGSGTAAVVPAGLTNVVAVAGGGAHSLALRADGSIVAWGYSSNGTTNVPAGLSNVVAIAGGGYHSLALNGLPAGTAAPRITGPTLVPGTVDQPLQYRIMALNGATAYGASGLPPGLTLQTGTGLITGRPTQAGTFASVLSTSNALGADERSVTFVINRPLPGVVGGQVSAVIGSGFNCQLLLVNGPDSVVALGLPAGLVLNPSTGLISGTPLQAGNFVVSLQTSNRFGSGAGALLIRVTPVGAWGSNSRGQITLPNGLENVIAVAGGGAHTLVLKAEGTVTAWGELYNGASEFEPAGSPPGLSNVVAIAAGANHDLALRSDGTVVAWAERYNEYGKATVPAGLNNVVGIAAGIEHSAALRADGSVVVWGGYSDGYYGFTKAVAPPGLTNLVLTSLAGGGSHVVAMQAGGRVVAWGYNGQGQTNVPAGLSNVVAVAAGASHSLALRSDGRVVAWGSNLQRQTNVPAGLSNVVAIAAGSDYSMALRADGTVVAWGANTSGQTNVPAALSNVVAIAAGGAHALTLGGVPGGVAAPRLTGPRFLVGKTGEPFYHRVVALNGATVFGADGLPAGLAIDPASGVVTGQPRQAGMFIVVVSAANALGRTEWPVTLFVNASPPGIVADLVPALIGNFFNYRLTTVNGPEWFSASGLPPGLSLNPTNGVISGLPTQLGEFKVSVVASNQFALGDGSVTIRVSPVAAWATYYSQPIVVPAGLSNVIAVAGGISHSLALQENGTVIAWGVGNDGQTNVPPTLGRAVGIGSGSRHSVALLADGTLAAWGKYYNGSSWVNMEVPAGLRDVVAVSAGGCHCLALRSDGSVVALGAYGEGSSATPATTPPGLSNVVAVASGEHYSLALRADGTVAAWGYPYSGLGYVPADLSNVVAIAAGAWQGLALRANGTVASWGAPTAPASKAPAGLSNVVAVAAGADHSLVLRSDGSVLAWGGSGYGQTNVPVALSNVVVIAAGGSHSLAVAGLPGGLAAPAGVGPRFLLGTVDHPFRQRVMALNGPTQYGAGGLPPGLTIDSATGLISGRPTRAGIYPAVFSAGNASGSTQWTVTIVVNLPLPGITAGGLVQAPLGDAFQHTLGPVNGAVFLTASDLPNGVLFDPSEGVIRGTPLETGEFPVSIMASNSYAMAVCTLDLRVSCVVAWGGVTEVAPALGNVEAISPSLALRADGTVVYWRGSPSQVIVTNAAAISDGGSHYLVLLRDGTLTSWGRHYEGQTNAPSGYYQAVAAGGFHSLALSTNGFVAAWGSSSYGATKVPAGLSNVVAIAAGVAHSLALRADGTLAAWGSNEEMQTSVPPGLSNVMAIAAGGYHNLALKTDGTVVAWGMNSSGQTNVPVGLSNVVAVGGGNWHSLVLLADGTVSAWGGAESPAALSNVVAVAGGYSDSVALVTARPAILRHPLGLTNDAGSSATFSVAATGVAPLAYQWRLNGTPIPGATHNLYSIPSVATNHAGNYSVVVSNSLGVAVSSNARLGVIANEPVDEAAVRALLASAKTRAEAHDLEGFMVLFAADYMQSGNDRSVLRQDLQGGLAAVQSFTLVIDRIEGGGTKARVYGACTITFNNGEPARRWSLPESGEEGLGLGWLGKTAAGWQIIGNQERASVRVATEHHIGAAAEAYLIRLTADSSLPIQRVTVAGPNGSTSLQLDSQWGGFTGWAMALNWPAVGAVYSFDVQFADGTHQVLNDTVKAWVPVGPKVSVTSLGGIPTIHWTDVSTSVPNADYYWVWVEGNGVAWYSKELPLNRSSIVFNEDGQATGSLQNGKAYSVVVFIFDSSGNYASVDAQFLQGALQVSSTSVSNGAFRLKLEGPAGGGVVLEASGDLKTWAAVQTNTLPAGGLDLVLPMSVDRQFFRARVR